MDKSERRRYKHQRYRDFYRKERDLEIKEITEEFQKENGRLPNEEEM